MKIKIALISVIAFMIGSLLQAAPVELKNENQQNIKVTHASDVEWTHLNPKRGDLAPRAGTIWGDRNGTGSTGFLLKPPSHFESPPHIHNISYRGIVIKGVIHNDDPDAEEMWMPAGSFWTQPKGEIHITSAEGADSLAYIEIEEGPYLVLPTEQAFDSGERPVNVDQSNIMWLNASDVTWVDQAEAKIAFLWGNTMEGELNGTFIKLPQGFRGTIENHGSTFRAVVIKGGLEHEADNDTKLEAGSSFSAEGTAVHELKTEKESMIYVRTNGKYDIASHE